jgi:hypothetical protein
MQSTAAEVVKPKSTQPLGMAKTTPKSTSVTYNKNKVPEPSNESTIGQVDNAQVSRHTISSRGGKNNKRATKTARPSRMSTRSRNYASADTYDDNPVNVDENVNLDP